MLAVKALTLWIVLAEGTIGVAGLIVNAKESPNMGTVFVGKVLKLLTLYLVVVLNNVTSDAEGLLIILSAIEEFMFASFEHMTHG